MSNLLSHHVRAGRIKSLGRNAYATIYLSPTSEPLPIDTFAIGAKLRNDGIFAYRSALELHGLAGSAPAEVVLLSL